MGEVRRTEIKSECNCSKKQLVIEFNFSIRREHLPLFIEGGFGENTRYTNRGIFCVMSNDLMAIAPFGGSKLEISCKSNKCMESLEKLESIIKNI